MSEDLKLHLDRLDAWLADLWAAKSFDLHMCDPAEPVRKDQFGLLRDIRADVAALRKAYRDATRKA
jgi:hypothetical protein